MTPRKYSGGTRRPGRPGSRSGRKPRVSGGGGKKGGVCSFAIPAAALALLVLLSQAALVRWQIRGTR